MRVGFVVAHAPPKRKAPALQTPQERAAAGKALRSEVPRSSHAVFDPPSDRPDPVDLLEEQAKTRVPELVPIRYGRMAVSAFTFFRGAAYLMASDLAGSAQSGLKVQCCGDAHLSNFGGFASPDRKLVFDINDFDETLPGPWEWDVKRLAASVEIAGRANGFRRKDRQRAVAATVEEYRQAMREFSAMSALEVWFTRLAEGEMHDRLLAQVNRSQQKRFEARAAKGRRKDSARAFAKLAHHVNGAARIVPDPPLVTPIEDLVPAGEAEEVIEGLREVLASYRTTLSADRRQLLDRYQMVDVARKVVGVGSVGTRAWVILMLGRDHHDPLFIQAKEAEQSVLERFAGKCEYDNQGRRVVEGQRLMQAASDIFLGWLRTTGIDDRQRDFYVRQLWDWKTSAEVETMRPEDMAVYGKMCGWTLARAHARSGDALAISGYLGGGDTFDRAIVEFADAYADQSERDYRSLRDAIDSGRLEAEARL